jgi:UDP-N-acetylglucosamine:LPS N-acetylglucosamine transferase
VQGPNYKKKLHPLEGLTIIEDEPELVNLLAISSLVIAEGGYNTVNEIRRVKVPAIFLPSERIYDNQEERVRLLEEEGLAFVFTGELPEKIVERVEEIITSESCLPEIQVSYKADQMLMGNRKAAEKILELVEK